MSTVLIWVYDFVERKGIQLNPFQTDQTHFYYLWSNDYVKILNIKEEINPAQLDIIWTLEWITKGPKLVLCVPIQLLDEETPALHG